MGDGFADVNGTRLYYTDRGEERGAPALLFMHGFTLDHRMWRAQATLADRFRVVAYDQRGFGRSALPDATYAHHDDAAALCAHLGVDRVVAVGHSIGAHRALELAIAYPRLVVALGTVCASALAGIPFPDDVLRAFGEIRAAAQNDLDAAKAIWSRVGWFTSARSSPALAAELDAMLADYSGWHFRNKDPVVNLAPPAAEQLDAIRVPALVLTGDRDLAYNDRVADALAKGIPHATRVRLPNAGHMANMEDPDAVSAAIAALAARAPR